MNIREEFGNHITPRDSLPTKVLILIKILAEFYLGNLMTIRLFLFANYGKI